MHLSQHSFSYDYRNKPCSRKFAILRFCDSSKFLCERFPAATHSISKLSTLSKSQFSLLGNMSSLLPAFSEKFPVRNVRQGLHYLAHFPGNLLPHPSASFSMTISHIRKLLEIHEETSDAVS